jgi:hypothetical protein
MISISKTKEFAMSNLNFNNKKNSNIEIDLNTERNLDLHNQRQIEDTIDNISSTINNTRSRILLDKSHEEMRIMYENISERINQLQERLIYNNREILSKYTETYNIINKNITENVINRTNFINEAVIESIESFYKSIEIIQKYFNNSIQNYFNYKRNLERSITKNS